MSYKESELTGQELPVFSKKTSSERLKEFVKQRWLSDGRIRVASDMFQNVKELLAGEVVNWDLILSNIRTQQMDMPRVGKQALEVNGARIVGSLGAACNWAMHDPEIVYLSARVIADRVKESEEIEGFKSRISQASQNYALRTLPSAELYMGILDYFLKLKPTSGYGSVLKPIIPMFQNGDIEGIYHKLINPREDLVRKRGRPSNKITSSILTPPNPGI
jgi:hypothetical protein